jgi:hypothetical protein
MVMDRLWLIAQARKPPRSLVYVALPNAGNSAPLEQLANRYIIGPERRFEASGYAISAYELTLR